MFRITNRKLNPSYYRIAFEVFGRTVEMGVTYNEFIEIKKKGTDLIINLKAKIGKKKTYPERKETQEKHSKGRNSLKEEAASI